MSDANDDAQNYALAVIAAVVALVIAGVLTLSISRSGPPKAPKAPAQAAAAPAAAAAPRVYFEVDSDALPGDAAELLARVAEEARAKPGAAVLISGFHDASGDPAKNAEETLSRAFGDVLHSLEGAIFEAATSADRLRDVRRKGQNGWAWNPELMTLVTAAMSKPPETPGGEPLSLADLLAVDPQVTFNNVARRVTRLKLFRILAAVRAFRKERSLDPDEPIFKNPNALLRRLVREGRFTEDLLLDPWGGTIQFTASAGPPIPFLTVVKGFELHAPGPDGAVGTGDDVRDPFERVLRSGTPYAKAVSEDRLVDAKFDLEIGDATVSNWEALFQELTGQAIGDSFGAGGLGLSGVGEGGGGRGSGIGLGSIGTVGHGRGTSSIADGVAFWSIPRRTDAKGHLRIHIPLGDIETTWRVALVGVPDGARPATTTLDIPVSLPLSARVDAGATWVAGDRVSASITLRNRSSAPIRATVDATPGGVALLPEGKPGASRRDEVEVPAGGARVVILPLHANVPGEGSLAVTVKAPGLPDDQLRHTWEVIPAGEPTDLSRSQWVEDSAELAVALDPLTRRPLGEITITAPRVCLAGSATGTPALLLRSGVPDPGGETGNHLHIHPAVVAAGDFDEPVRAWQGIPQTYECTEHLDFEHEGGPRAWIVPAFAHPAGTAAIMPGHGEAHRGLMRRYDHLAVLTAMIHDRTPGKVRPDGDLGLDGGRGGEHRSPLLCMCTIQMTIAAVRLDVDGPSQPNFAARPGEGC